MDERTPAEDDGGAEIVKLAARMLALVESIEFHDAPRDSPVAAHYATLAGYTALLGAAEAIAPSLSAEERDRVRALTPGIVRRLRAKIGAFQKTRGDA